MTDNRWTDDRITWRGYRDSYVNDWEVGLADEAMNWHDAQALAESPGGNLAKVADPVTDPGELGWFVETYRPQDGQEAQYWLGGWQSHASGLYCDDPDETPWVCWNWKAPPWPWGTSAESFCWRPADACEGDQWFQYIYCPTNGWLPGQPDDGGAVCQDNHQEDHMLLVLNEGNDPNTNGFADANSSGLYRALIMREACKTAPTNYARNWAMEFRYDGARQRYLTRRLNPTTLTPMGDEHDQWTAYLGDEPVDDYQVNSFGQRMVENEYLFGVAEWHADADTTGYLHGDLIGSTVAVTSDDATPAVLRRVVYTAFGEAISVAGPDGNPAAAPFATRYGYAGAFGYQEHDVGSCGLIGTNSLPPAEGCTPTTWSPDGLPDSLLNASPLAGFRFQHLGHRYYDPSTGRFIQRDPMGIRGGRNVYAYAASAPQSVDPQGLVTLQVGVEAGVVGIPPQPVGTGVAGGAGVAFGTGDGGSIGVYIDGTVFLTGLAGGAWGGKTVTVTSAGTVSQLSGVSTVLSCFAGVWGFQGLFSPSYWGGGVGWGPGWAAGASVGFNYTYTASVSLKPITYPIAEALVWVCPSCWNW